MTGGPLAGKTTLVTGATRGAGLAIAQELGRAGATVIVTGRTTRATGPREGLPGNVEDAADAVTQAGGRGIPIRCDHAKMDDVRALRDQIPAPLDALVCNAWGGYEQHDTREFVRPFWEHDFETRWRTMFEAGLRASLLAAHVLAPKIADGGLLLATVAWDEGKYLGAAYYDVAKAAIVRATQAWAHDLRARRIASMALAPGFMRTERVMAAHAQHPFDLSATESPTYLGRAVVALARDPNVLARSGRVQYVGDLARELGFTDEDGRAPPRFALPES